MRLTNRERMEIEARIQRLGFTVDETAKLRRIAGTLSRWDEAECNGDIERDDDGRPYRVIVNHRGNRKRFSCRDLERGAILRLRDILRHHPEFAFYRQCDPRGASLYVVRADQIPTGIDLDCIYSGIGTAIY